MRHPILVHGRQHQPPPMPTVWDSAGQARQRVLALFLPVAAALCISAEALNPRGTDQPITSRATAVKELPIAAQGTPDCRASPGSALPLRLAGPPCAGGAGRLLPGDRHPDQEPWFGPRHRRHADRGNWCFPAVQPGAQHWPAGQRQGCPACGLRDLGTHRPPGITARPQRASGK